MQSHFHVSLVVAGFEFDDTNLDELFAYFPDAVPSNVGGLVTISTPIDSADAVRACLDFADRLARLFPDIVIMRVDQDLVAISDIAARTGRTRESIRLIADGKRGPGTFPAPLGIVGDAIRVWPWSVVAEWFATDLHADLDERGVPPEVAIVVDAQLLKRRAAALTSA